MTDRKWTCDNCPYRGVATKQVASLQKIRRQFGEDEERLYAKRPHDGYFTGDTVEDNDDGTHSLTYTAMCQVPEDYDACFFNPVITECPPQNWCGRHPAITNPVERALNSGIEISTDVLRSYYESEED